MLHIELNRAARRMGVDTVAATKALSHAIALTCRSLQTLVETSDEVGMPELGSGKEAQRVTAALEAMMTARDRQVAGRISLLRKAQTLEIEEFGEGCPCGGAIAGEQVVSALPG